MKIHILHMLSIFLMTGHIASAQILHPWHVVDNGGGRSTAGSVTLQASIGQPAIAAMASGSTNLESGYIPGLRNLYGGLMTVNDSLTGGWDLISLPVAVTDSSTSVIFPEAISQAFAFNGGYTPENALHNGSGYWLKFGAPVTVPLSGTTVSQESVSVAAGWNMIGPPSSPVAVSDIIPVGTAVVSNYFGYQSSYLIEDTLVPGMGYWVKVSQLGKLFLKAGPFIVPGKNSSPITSTSKQGTAHPLPSIKSQEGIGYLSFVDATGSEGILYFSSSRTDLNPDFYELPPLAPSQQMDARYATNRMLEVAEAGTVRDIPILLSAAIYPVKVTWKLGNHTDPVAMVINGKEFSMAGDKEITIENEKAHLGLRIQSGGAEALPKTFALHQNYPNPFNPTTAILYDLPVDAHVELKIYNILGQDIVTLKDDVESAGYKSVEWNSTNRAGIALSSGVYFYRLEATSADKSGKTFTQIRKSLLLK